MHNKTLTLVVGLLVTVALAAPFAPVAVAAAPGTMYIAPEAIELGGKDLEARLKKVAVKSVKRPESGEWTFFLVAYLRKSPGSTSVSLLLYDTAEKNQKEPNSVIQLNTTASARILATTVSFSEDSGLKPGHTYNLVVARKVGGHDEIYAKGQLELK